MIHKLRRRFILSSTAAILVLLALVFIPINGVIYLRNQHESDLLLQYISQAEGEIPSVEVIEGTRDSRNLLTGLNLVNRDSLLQMRFFTVWANAQNQVERTKLDYIAEVSDQQARQYEMQVLSSRLRRGQIANSSASYEYLLTRFEDGSSMTVFLDTTTSQQSLHVIVSLSFMAALASVLLFVFLVLIFSGRAVAPMVRNYEAQKQFITNAGHELKTPIAIISANAELLEMMHGENEWTQSIRKQSKRLEGLVAKLITLTRMGEQERVQLADIDFSAIVSEAAQSYRPVVEQQHKSLIVKVDPGVQIHAEEKLAGELVNILLDNASKYCDEEGRIVVSLRRRRGGRGAHFVVENSYAAGAQVDYNRFFDRFYRGDDSHCSEKAGYGIGLSMAQGIVEDQFKGSIKANYRAGNISFIVIL